jgi:hypothetical protein
LVGPTLTTKSAAKPDIQPTIESLHAQQEYFFTKDRFTLERQEHQRRHTAASDIGMLVGGNMVG